MIPLETIDELINEHDKNPSKRLLQTVLAKEMTTFVHSESECQNAINASSILFGNSTTEQLATIDEHTLLSALHGVPQVHIDKNKLENGISIIDFALFHENISSKGEARKLIKANGLSINKAKADLKTFINEQTLIDEKYIILQKVKKTIRLL